jgi:hypothetical protein
MTPPKKAVSKPAKPAPKHHEGKDWRRAHEHRGRVEALLSSLGKNAADIDTLVEFAEQEVAGSHLKDAADLLRAAEHLSFGYLASSKSEEQVPKALSDSLKDEFEHKMDKAAEHWEEPAALRSIYDKAINGAQKAFDDGAYRKAMELVRAAEAIAHVHLHGVEES